jgi:hypothetical protein
MILASQGQPRAVKRPAVLCHDKWENIFTSKRIRTKFYPIQNLLPKINLCAFPDSVVNDNREKRGRKKSRISMKFPPTTEIRFASLPSLVSLGKNKVGYFLDRKRINQLSVRFQLTEDPFVKDANAVKHKAPGRHSSDKTVPKRQKFYKEDSTNCEEIKTMEAVCCMLKTVYWCEA